MRIAVISDVHGNLAALEAVLAGIGRLGADEILSLGDVVGYGPDPSACLAAVRERCTVCLAGNHDAAVAGRSSLGNFNEYARRAAAWTTAALSAAELAYLAAQPLVARREGLLLVHASPREPEAWHYLFGPEDAAGQFDAFSEQLCLVGHTHRPGILALDPEGTVTPGAFPLAARRGRRCLVNAGSVGQPRDRDPRASFLLLDGVRGVLTVHRVAYPVERTQRRMREAGLPAFLAERLAVGI